MDTISAGINFIVHTARITFEGVVHRAVIDGQFSIDILRDKYQRYIDIYRL
jgi:hypothetical protein